MEKNRSYIKFNTLKIHKDTKYVLKERLNLF